MKNFTLIALTAVAASASAATEKPVISSRLSVTDIPHRQIERTLVNTELRTLENRTTPSVATPVGKTTRDVNTPACLPEMRAAEGQECLDSIIRVSLAGNLVSKQTFGYNKSGLPTVCNSYLPGQQPDEWNLYSTYAYEYDDLDRVILKASINNEYHDQDFRYEYFYTDDTPNYTTEIFYYFNENDFVPAQMGEYGYDDRGNLTFQIFEYFDPEQQTWVKVNKKTYSWDEGGRQTSYFYYEWDEAAGGWIGSVMSGDCEEYYYTPEGNDSLIKGFVWENGDWFNYRQTVYTYNEQGLCIKDEDKYWNRDRQDWSGGDAWGPYGMIFNNQYADNTYNEDGQLILQEVYSVNAEGESVLHTVFSSEYTDLGEGNVEAHKILSLRMAADTPPAPWSESIERFNKWGSEYYYKGFTYINGIPVANSEDIRHMDEYNNYLGGEFYGFNSEGVRYGQSKEQFNYPADYDPALQLMTPSEGIHWRGTSPDSDDSWALSSRDVFTWTDGYPVMSGSINSRYSEEGEEQQVSYFAVDYNTSVLMEGNLIFWKDYNKRDNFYYYKINSVEEGVNMDYETGDTEWDADWTYNDYYYYGILSTSAVNTIAMDPNAVEVARYNVAGLRLEAPAPGINIVVYSDGSVRKVVER